MNPTWLRKGSLEASGRPWGAEAGIERFWVQFWALFGGLKIVKVDPGMAPKIKSRFGAVFLSFWGPLGCILGAILGSFWGRLSAPGRVGRF